MPCQRILILDLEHGFFKKGFSTGMYDFKLKFKYFIIQEKIKNLKGSLGKGVDARKKTDCPQHFVILEQAFATSENLIDRIIILFRKNQCPLAPLLSLYNDALKAASDLAFLLKSIQEKGLVLEGRKTQISHKDNTILLEILREIQDLNQNIIETIIIALAIKHSFEYLQGGMNDYLNAIYVKIFQNNPLAVDHINTLIPDIEDRFHEFIEVYNCCLKHEVRILKYFNPSSDPKTAFSSGECAGLVMDWGISLQLLAPTFEGSPSNTVLRMLELIKKMLKQNTLAVFSEIMAKTPEEIFSPLPRTFNDMEQKLFIEDCMSFCREIFAGDICRTPRVFDFQELESDIEKFVTPIPGSSS